MRGTRTLGIALLGLALPMAAEAQAAAAAPAGYTMPSTRMWDMTADSGETYRIFVSYPAEGEPPEHGYPVLYVLDGNASFAAFAETRRLQEFGPIGKMIVVGVGYPTDKTYDYRRLYDLTAPLLDPAPQAWRSLAKYRSGGQDVFLDFLTGKLRAEIGRRFRINPERQSLFGHSLGGTFALHTLYTRPNAFYSIVSASPSMEWNEQETLKEERAFAARLTSGRIAKVSRLMIVVGGRDVEDDPHLGEALARRLDLLSGHGLRSRLRRYEEEVHITVPARSVTDVLRFVSEGF